MNYLADPSLPEEDVVDEAVEDETVDEEEEEEQVEYDEVLDDLPVYEGSGSEALPVYTGLVPPTFK